MTINLKEYKAKMSEIGRECRYQFWMEGVIPTHLYGVKVSPINSKSGSNFSLTMYDAYDEKCYSDAFELLGKNINFWLTTLDCSGEEKRTVYGWAKITSIDSPEYSFESENASKFKIHFSLIDDLQFKEKM